MAPRPDVSEARRSQILDVAEDIFARRGFSETRMDDLVEASGLSKGAIYWYFRKKDDVIAALLERVFRRSLDGIDAIAAAEGTVIDRLMRTVDRIASDYRSLAKLAPIAVDFYSVALRNRGVRSFIATMYKRYQATLGRLLQEGVQNGELRRDLEVNQTCIAMIALFEGMGLVWAIDRKFVDWNYTPAAAAHVLIEGIRA